MGFWDIFKTKKAEPVQSKPKKQNLGASWDTGHGTRPIFPPREALEAYGEHAYLYAAVTRCSEDLSALPLKLIKGKGKNAKIIDSHPVLDLLEQPSTIMDGYLFRQQITLDLIMNGTFYVLLIGAGKLPASLIRLHPEETTFVTDNITGIKGIKNTSYGQSVIYPSDRVLFGRNASYSKGPKSLYGTGTVQPLYEELKADTNAMMLSSQQSAQGRPDVLISPSDEADVWPKEVRDEIVQSYTQMARKGGAIALSGMAKIDMLNLSPREMEYKEARTMARQSISAAIGISPSVLGLPSANYATAMEQRKTYWTNQMHKAKRLETVYTQLARLWNNDFRIVHDFSGISALDDRKEALERIEMHIRNGMSPIAAYAYENLEDAPIEPSITLQDTEVEEEEEKILSEYIFKSDIDEGKARRKQIWYKWIVEKQAPAEGKLVRASASFLRTVKRKALDRFDDMEELGATPESIIPKSEMQEIADEKLRKLFKSIYQSNFNSEYARMKRQLKKGYHHKEIELPENQPSEGTLGKWIAFYLLMRSRIIETTYRKLGKLLAKVAANEAKKDVAAKLAASSAFAPSRADVIGRTESTILLNNSAVQAGQAISEDDPQVETRKEWITENDADVRPEHEELDGVRLGINDYFETSGGSTQYPGGFGVASLDVNCRCVTVVDAEYFYDDRPLSSRNPGQSPRAGATDQDRS